MKQLFDGFFNEITNDNIEIYNEFSLQHELGIYLRSNMPNKKIQFEKNVKEFFGNKDFEKKEIDISIIDNNKLETAIELKFPRNGQVPESMFSFCKDICFLEQLKKRGCKNAYFIALVDSHLFYEGNKEGIYRFFRDEKSVINGIIKKPTGASLKTIEIKGQYIAKWQFIKANKNSSKKDLYYCYIEVQLEN